MSSLDNKKSILDKKYLSFLRQIPDDDRLIEALDVVKNEFVSTDALDYGQVDKEDVDGENFKIRQCIYNLLKHIRDNKEEHDILESNLDHSIISSPAFTKHLKEVCRAIVNDPNGLEVKKIHIPTYLSSTWSVDIDLSSSYAKKLLETSVTLNLNIKEPNGKISSRSLMMTSEKFSELRYNVAEALKTLNDSKKKKIFSQ